MHGWYVNRKPFSILDEIDELYFSETAELRSVRCERNLVNICSFLSQGYCQMKPVKCQSVKFSIIDSRIL